MCLIRTFAASAALTFLAGCMSSGPVPIGRDTYMISKTGYLTGSATAADIFREAGQFCAQQNRELQPVYENSRDAAVATYASAEIHFRCLAANDPELRRPSLRPTPNVRVDMEK